MMVASSSTPRDVHIDCDQGSCTVREGEIDIKPGDKVKFHNPTEGFVSIVFSEELLFLPDSKIKIEKGKDRTVTAQKVQRGIYPYAVYCECIQDFATASSMPIIIIKR